MHLVQILLPLRDNEGRSFPRAMYEELSAELTERFGGVTAWTRSPAEGRWREEGAHETRDDIVVYEVMDDDLAREWWAVFRRSLEGRFSQDVIVIRAQETELL